MEVLIQTVYVKIKTFPPVMNIPYTKKSSFQKSSYSLSFVCGQLFLILPAKMLKDVETNFVTETTFTIFFNFTNNGTIQVIMVFLFFPHRNRVALLVAQPPPDNSTTDTNTQLLLVL